MKLYIAGPMRGLPAFNFPAFYAAEETLTAVGHECFNPARRDNDHHGADISAGNLTGDEHVAAAEHGFSLRDALAADCEYICRHAEGLFMLPGWNKSAGARAEHALAKALGLEILGATV